MKVFFLDRDGVLIEDENYLKDPDKVRLCSGAADALKMIRDAGYGIIMTSNQSGIARGFFTMDDVKTIERTIVAKLKADGAVLPDAWYYCPHHPTKGTVAEFVGPCSCRKPEPGMLLQAKIDFGIEMPESFMIGDKLGDLQAAFRAGCHTGALVLTGHGREQKQIKLARPYIVADNIFEAVKKLLESK